MSNRDIMENSMGYNGAEFISNTVAHPCDTGLVYVAIQAITDVVISAYTTGAPISGNVLTGIVLSAGTVIYGRFRSITLTSGQLLAYKGV